MKHTQKKPLGRLYFIRMGNNYAFIKRDTKTLKTLKLKTQIIFSVFYRMQTKRPEAPKVLKSIRKSIFPNNLSLKIEANQEQHEKG